MWSFNANKAVNLTFTSWKEVTIAQGLSACFRVWLWVAYYSTMGFIEAPAFVIFTMWVASSRFRKLVDDDKGDNEENLLLEEIEISLNPTKVGPIYKWQEIYFEFRKIRHISQTANKIFGKSVLIFIASSILEYAMFLQSLPENKDIARIVEWLFWLWFTIITLSLAANISCQVTTKT